ncbi:hypothetical protein ABPG77_004918 [Micractinium sp. CCAP 211/92]
MSTAHLRGPPAEAEQREQAQVLQQVPPPSQPLRQQGSLQYEHVLVCAQCGAASCVKVDSDKEAALGAALAAATEWPCQGAPNYVQHDSPGVPVQQHEPGGTPGAVAEAAPLAAADAAAQAQQPVQQQAQQGAAPRLAAAAQAGAPAAPPGTGTADQPPTAWRKHLETTPPGECWLCKACSREIEGLQRAEKAQQIIPLALLPWRRQVNATILKRVLNIKRKHLAQCFGWDAATQMPPRMSLHISGRMLRDGTASVMGFNKEGRDGFPFKARWLGMLLDALGAQLDDVLVLQHRFTTAAGVMHVAASLGGVQAGQAAQQAANREAAPQPSWTPSDIANYTAGCRSDFLSTSSDARYGDAAKQQEAGEEVEQPGRHRQQKRRRLESAARPREAAAAVVEAQPPPLAAPPAPAALPAEQGQQASARPADPGAAAAMQPPADAAAAEDGAVASAALHPPATAAAVPPGRFDLIPQADQLRVLPAFGGGTAWAPTLYSQASFSPPASVDPGSGLTAAFQTGSVGLRKRAEAAAATASATAAMGEDKYKFVSPCGKRYVYEGAMRTHARGCEDCKAKMPQEQGQQRAGSLPGAGSGATLDTLCVAAAEMELDAVKGSSEPTEQATEVFNGEQPVTAMAGMQSTPVGGMPGSSPQLHEEAAAARAADHTVELPASEPPPPQLQGQATAAQMPIWLRGLVGVPARLQPSLLHEQARAAWAAEQVALAAAAQAAEQVAGLPASMLQPPQLRGQAGAAWAAEQVAGPPPSVPPLTHVAPVVSSAQQPVVPAKAAQLSPALPTVDTLRRRLQQTPVDRATVEAYLAEWAAMPPSVQAGEWQVLKEYIKTDDMASLEVHVRSML